MLKRAAQKFRSHRYGLTLVAFLTAAVASGAVCVFFMRSFSVVIAHRLDFDRVGNWAWLTTPAGFLISVIMIRRLAPEAEGTGIPQAIFAATHATPGREKKLHPLMSMRTFLVKGLSLLIGVWACASTGREGPSVHLAACTFVGVMVLFRSATGLAYDFRSAVVAGSAAGLAAAFNTPLAGVTFAIEELSSDYFDSIKEVVLLAIVFSAIAAKSMTGEYAYFGRLPDPADVPVYAVILIGVLGGLLGAGFSTLILKGGGLFKAMRRRRFGLVTTAVFALLLAATGYFAGSRVFGAGNEVASQLLDGHWDPSFLTFPWEKIASTLLTYWSGLAGGIFAPCLAVGASIGANLGQWIGISTATCAIIGMAAFLSGTIQAPVTTFVIIFEMTGNHRMLLPVMLSTMIAFIVSKIVGAEHLYKGLAEGYRYLLPGEPMPTGGKH